ncbi:psychosine receptor-like [Salarias fasciatus]|uniref:psychosine receptor-like n=1 Tax=Salarias fasciatus TaxID=181472 RepID=UPI001176A388|nr:psychosine receptor-like [Salarias fasciatus]
MDALATMENLSLAANLSDCFLVQHITGSTPSLFFYLTIIVIAIPSNTFSLYVSWQHIRQKNELGVFLFNLALCDMIFTLGLTLWVDFLWRGVWTHGSRLCVICVCFVHTNFYTSEALLCCIAVNRYLAVVHPLKYVKFRKMGTAVAVSVAIWVLVLCFSAATIKWRDLYNEDTMTSLCFDLFLPMSESQICGNLTRFFLGFIAPVAVVLFTTWGTCAAVNTNQATKEQERKRISKLLALVLFSLMLCFGPLHVLMLVRTFLSDCSSFQWLFYPYRISIAISSLNCLADPLLYCFVTRTGQANVSQVILFLQGKKRSNDESIA